VAIVDLLSMFVEQVDASLVAVLRWLTGQSISRS